MASREGRGAGWMLFAGVMMILVGGWSAIEGALALIDPEAMLKLGGTVYLVDLSTWAWMHIIFGGILFITGFGILNVSTWARIVGIVFVSLNLIGRMFSLSVHPVWGVIIILMDLAIIYSLCVYHDSALE